MTAIIIASHGPLAAALVEAAQVIVGPAAERAIPICLAADDNLEAMRDRLLAALDGRREALVLVDLMGGTPANAAAWSLAAAAGGDGPHWEVVSGANLPMLLEVLLADGDLSARELARLAVQVGQAGITNVGDALHDSQHDPGAGP